MADEGLCLTELPRGAGIRLVEFLTPSAALLMRKCSYHARTLLTVKDIETHAADLFNRGYFGPDWKICSGASLGIALRNCALEDVNAVYGLLSASCCPNLNANDEAGIPAPPLCRAASRGFASTLSLLLEARASPNTPAADKLTPLDYAISSGKMVAAALLLNHAAKPSNAHEALRVAAGHRGSLLCVQRLVAECGADVDGAIDAAIEYGDVDVAVALMSSPQASDRLWTRRWALRRAAILGDVAVLQAACALPGVDIDDGAGTSWGTAVVLAAEEGHLKACRWLLDKGADPGACRRFTDGAQWTAAEIAQSKGYSAIHELLIQANATQGCES